MPVTPKVVRNYVTNAILGALSTVIVGISWTLVKVPENKCVGSDELQWYHIVGFIVSITVFGCSLFAVLTIVKKLRDPFSDLHHILFIVVGLLIAASGGVVGYAAVFAFSRPRTSSPGGLISIDTNVSGNNIFQAKDAYMITVFFLDLLVCGMLLAAGLIVGRRGTK